MTTSPFGTPLQPDPAPAPDAPAAASSRKPLLITLGGVAAVALVGAGAFFLLGPDGENVAEVPVPRGQGATPSPSAEPTPSATPSPDVTLSSRNPFAAQVLAGGAGAPATAPESGSSAGGSSGSAGSSSSGSSAGSGGAGAAGKDGQDGEDGRNGKDGRNGANGVDGLTPMFVTIQVVDVDETTNTVDAVVRTTAGQTTPIDLPTGSPFDADPETVAGQVVYKAVGADTSTPADGQIDFVTITVDGVDYTTQVGETFLGFVYR